MLRRLLHTFIKHFCLLFIPCQDHGISFSAHTFQMNYFYTERILDLSSSAFNPLFSDWKNRTSLRRVQGVWGNVHFQFSSDLLVIWYYIDRISPFPNLLIFLIISSCSLLIYGNLTAKFCHTGYCCFLPILWLYFSCCFTIIRNRLNHIFYFHLLFKMFVLGFLLHVRPQHLQIGFL